MTTQLVLEINDNSGKNSFRPLRPRLLNLVILGDADALHQLLDIPWQTAKDACDLWYELNRLFLCLFVDGQDSEIILREGKRLEDSERSIIEALIYQAQKHS